MNIDVFLLLISTPYSPLGDGEAEGEIAQLFSVRNRNIIHKQTLVVALTYD